MSVAPDCSVQVKEYSLSTNLAELPNDLHWRLAGSLNFQNVWMKIIDNSAGSAFSLNVLEYDHILRAENQGSSLLYLWGNRGQTVKHLLQRLQSFSKIHGKCMDGPQLALRRKFVSVIWSAETQVTVKVTGTDACMLQLICHARGFPWPNFQWMEDERDVEGAHGRALVIPRCSCRKTVTYKCRIWNEIEEGFEYSTFYRKSMKLFHSQLVTDPVDLSTFIICDLKVGCCDRCTKCVNLVPPGSANDYKSMKNKGDTGGWNAELVATDKVALIISNSNYSNLCGLATPHCDAEMLAESLQNLGFKTVALGDLNLAEMHFFISEYRKLLGDGVYAVFYFVGHGFEKNGKNYLLAVDAPGVDCRLTDCVSVDWILAAFGDSHPALNLILLDVCRKNMRCIGALESEDVNTEKIPKIARNTVCGYATSSGVSAFEVHGEKNGIFMKHLLQHITDDATVLEMLTKTFQEIANDARICDVQIPELKSNLVLPRGLQDQLVISGHTASFSYHTLHWRYMHELPNPVHVQFIDQKLSVIVWYDYAGHFTNKVYVFSSVGNLLDGNSTESLCLKASSAAVLYVAHLRFPEHFDVSAERVIEDGEEGVSLCVMLSNLQRSGGPISCTVDLSFRDDDKVIASKSNVRLGDVLITRIYRSEYKNASFCYGGD